MPAEATQWKITLSDIDFGPEEERAVVEVLRSKWLTMGAKTAEFERLFAETVGARHAVAVNNCTAALHLALLAVGVGPGDEVIVPALTFVATANAVLYCGGTPIFADIIGPDDLLIDPDDVARKIGPRTKVVLPVHYAGYACDMARLEAITRPRGIRIVDDAAHAPGTVCDGRAVGNLCEASCFSFFSNKNLVTGEGGMITTNDDAIATFVRLNRSHGMTALSYDKIRGHAFTYDVVSAGYNYRLTELQSALGIAQLAKLERNNAIRRSLIAVYRPRLQALGVRVPFAGRDATSACHILSVQLPTGIDRVAVQEALKERGIQTSVHYLPIHRFSNFAGRYSAIVPHVDAIADRLLTLPLHPLMSRADVEHVCDALALSL